MDYAKELGGLQTVSGAAGVDALLTPVDETVFENADWTVATPASGSDLQPVGMSTASLSEYPQIVQNIVRATGGDPFAMFDLIRNHVEFQPYFGFRKSPEATWMSRRGNDADQTLLLIECLRAAGYTAHYQFGLLFMPEAQARAWFGVDDLSSLIQVTGNAGYLSGATADELQFAIEQIWCMAEIDGSPVYFSPAFKTYEEIARIDLAAAMGYSRAGLLAAARGTETADYVRNVDEVAISTYLRDRAMELSGELQTNYPDAGLDEIVSGRRIVPLNSGEHVDDAFYTPDAYVSGSYPTFLFADPYLVYGFAGNTYRFYTEMALAVGIVNFAGDQFNAPPFIYYEGPSALFSGKNIAVSFTEDSRAELRVGDERVESELSLTPGEIGIGYSIDYPFHRAEAGTAFDEVRIRPIKRGSTYAYAYDSGGAGEIDFRRQSRLRIDGSRRAGLTASDPEILSETLHLMGLDWLHQFDRMVRLLGKMQNLTPVVHHTMALIQQGTDFGVDIPTTTLPISSNQNMGQDGENLRAMTVMGSAMEHGVLEQSAPGSGAVSTVRYVRENNLAGGKTFYATSANYASVKGDPDFVAGWSGFFRNTVFQSAVTNGSTLIIPGDGNILMDALEGYGYFERTPSGIAALIGVGEILKGGFATTAGLLDFTNNPFPWDPTFGPENLENPLSYDPIDMLTGAYVYDTTDLLLSGEGVRGLAFTRHYSSLAAGIDTGMGKGWSHGHQSSIVEHSDTSAAFGEATPVHAASMIAALWATRDMAELETSPKAWVVGSLAAYWAMEQVKDNTATVTIGRQTLPFTRLADGSFVPPAGINAALEQDEVTGLYTLEERFDVVSAFDADNRLASITDAAGKQLTFD